MYDLKSLLALSLAVKDLDAVIRDLVEVQSLCPITSWDVTVLGGPGAISVCPPSPTPEEVQGWFAELLQVPATSPAWCEVLADAFEVSERARSHFAARDAHHGEAVLLQHIAENNIWVYPYIATSTDTMCFACYKLLLAVNAQRSMRLWTSSCSDESHLPRHLPALPEDVETCLVEDLMNDLRILAETHQDDLAYCKKLISEGELLISIHSSRAILIAAVTPTVDQEFQTIDASLHTWRSSSYIRLTIRHFESCAHMSMLIIVGVLVRTHMFSIALF